MNGTTMASAGFPAGVPGEWQHALTGTVAVWLINGLNITSVGFSGSTTPDWKVEGVGMWMETARLVLFGGIIPQFLTQSPVRCLSG